MYRQKNCCLPVCILFMFMNFSTDTDRKTVVKRLSDVYASRSFSGLFERI